LREIEAVEEGLGALVDDEGKGRSVLTEVELCVYPGCL
jgi:hypothetical protein